MWLHKQLASHHLCSPNKPRLLKTIGKKGKIYFYYRIWTYTKRELFFLYTAFYSTGIKRIPMNIGEFLTPQLLAILFMCDGAIQNKGAMICLDGFELRDLVILQKALYTKWGFKTGIHKAGWKKTPQKKEKRKSQSQNQCSNIKTASAPKVLPPLEGLALPPGLLRRSTIFDATPKVEGKTHLTRRYRIYFGKTQMPQLSKLIKKHMVPSMHYKLGGY